jgi:hypothetical protein
MQFLVFAFIVSLIIFGPWGFFRILDRCFSGNWNAEIPAWEAWVVGLILLAFLCAIIIILAFAWIVAGDIINGRV